MGVLRFEQERPGRPFCVTDFGTYRLGFYNYPVFSDIGSLHGEERPYTTVYWCFLDREELYRGFDVNAAFDAAEHDYIARRQGALNGVPPAEALLRALGKKAA